MIFFFLLIEHDLRYTTLLSEMVSLFEILMSSCEGTIELSFWLHFSLVFKDLSVLSIFPPGICNIFGYDVLSSNSPII